MKIGIIGMGFVGETLSKVLEGKKEVIAFDKYKEPFKDASALTTADIIFICVPTPMKNTGEIDLSIVEETLTMLSNMNFEKKPTIVIRSTVVPGTVKHLEEKYSFEFVSNPEFLREKNALQDFLQSTRIIIGANKPQNSMKVKELYADILPNAKILEFDSTTSEMIKYASNTFLSSQVILANEIFNICQKLEVDYEGVRQALAYDDRIAKNIKVPGPDGDFGFGGKCFQKDVSALVFLSKEKGYNPTLLKKVLEMNEEIRKNKDWLEIKGATSENKFC